ncbi:MAG: sialate O-acetylesterase, partial [Lacunisphaera sp.]
MKSSPIRCLLGVLATSVIANAAVQLASPFGEHMVLQQGRRIPVWGTADAGEKVSVEFASHTKTTMAGRDGKWRVDLDPLPVSAVGRIFTVTGSATRSPIKIGDVLVGEVWICGGQSNMERQLGPRPPQKLIVNWEQEVAAANHPLIRQFYVTQELAPAPKSTLEGKWTVCSP